jgi:hypothetical protein
MRVWAERKKGPRDVDDISGATGEFFLFTHFIFILLTKFFKYYFKLLTTMTTTTERPPPLACKPLARRVDCGDDEMTGRTLPLPRISRGEGFFIYTFYMPSVPLPLPPFRVGRGFLCTFNYLIVPLPLLRGEGDFFILLIIYCPPPPPLHFAWGGVFLYF